MGYRGLQEVTAGCKGLLGVRRVSRNFKRLRGATRGYWGLQRVTGGLQEVTRGYRGLQGLPAVTGDYKGLRKG